MMCSATSERFVFVAGYSSSSRCGETAIGLSIMWGQLLEQVPGMLESLLI